MTETLELIIRQARLRGHSDTLFDIGIDHGRITGVQDHLNQPAQNEIQARGRLATLAFANPHLHLDKVYTLERLDDQALMQYHAGSMGGAMTAIELAARVKEDYDRAWILPNVRRALNQALRFGNTHIRAFADVDRKAGLEGVAALLEAKAEFQGRLELQVVAFPQDGVLREPGATDLVRQALEMGADIVGGIPWIEFTQTDAQLHIAAMFDLAQEYDKGISMLVDDAGDPGLRTLEILASETLARGWHGRVLAHHARAMALYPEPSFRKLAALLRKAQIALVSDPHTGPLHARVRDLRSAGVRVCLGQDDISDAYYPFGRNNMLEVAFLAAHMLWMTTPSALEDLYDMITIDAARAMGLEGFDLQPGSEAHLVVLQAENLLEALRHHAPPYAVISHGQLLEPEGSQD